MAQALKSKTKSKSKPINTNHQHHHHHVSSKDGNSVTLTNTTSTQSLSPNLSKKESTRIIIKNLPKYMTKERLKAHFEKYGGTITDVKLMLTKEGVFRRFAYIGYKTTKEAAAAVRYFDQTFIDTTKIQVELALGVGDPNLPRPWSKHSQSINHAPLQTFTVVNHSNSNSTSTSTVSLSSSSSSKVTESDTTPSSSLSKIDELQLELKKRQVLQDYLTASKTKSWANDEMLNVHIQPVKDKKPGGQAMLLRSHIVFDKESDKETTTKHDKSDIDDDDEYQTLPSLSALGKTTMATKPLMSNELKNSTPSSSLTGTQPTTQKESHHLNSSTSTPSPSKVQATKDDPQAIRNEKEETSTPIAPTTLVSTSSRLPDPEKDLPLIEEHRRLFVLNLPYSVTEQELTTFFQSYGKLSNIHIPIFKDTKQGKGMAYITFVFAKDAKKAYEQLQHTSFQGRFLRILGAHAPPSSNSTSSTSSHTTGGFTSKSSFKDVRAQERQANASDPTQWNPLFMNTNTLAEITAQQLGLTKSEIMDPTQSDLAVRLALVETQYVHQARSFLASYGIHDISSSTPRSDHILLAKHLSSNVTVPMLTQWFSQFGHLGRLVMPEFGMFALIEFLVPSEAQLAFRHSVYKKLGSLPLYLEWAPITTFSESPEQVVSPLPSSSNTSSLSSTDLLFKPVKRAANEEHEDEVEEEMDENEEESASNNTKLLVRNVPFEATAKDLRQLFSAVAQLKRLRLPKKVTGGHRGFAFIEFLTSKEASMAMKALSHTHLYGRKLVLEYAEQEETLTSLRAKTKLIGQSRLKKRKVELAPKSLSEDDEDED